jgi:hypothetical protein
MSIAKSNYNELATIAANNINFSLKEKKLIVTDKNSTIEINLIYISNVRIIKDRSLFINYLCVLITFFSYQFLNKLLSNNFTADFFLKLLLLAAILLSLSVKKYSYSVLINTTDLSFYKFKIIRIKEYS